MNEITIHRGGILFTAILRREESGNGFAGTIAEMPGPYARGATLAETREELKKQILSFFASNREFALQEIHENAVQEIVVLEALTDSNQTIAANQKTGAVIITERLRIPLPIRIQFGARPDEFIQDLIDSNVVVNVTFDMQKLRQLIRALAVVTAP